jgi:son of sevenless-like protein
MTYPENLTEPEIIEWRDRCLQPTQRMILNVFTIWLEEQRLLEEEPHISRRLIEFLELIKPPSVLSQTADLIIKSITRLVSV